MKTILKHDIAATFSGNIAGTILACGSAIILARVLGPAGRGLLGLALLIPDITGKIFALGHDAVNMTFAGLYKDKRSSLFQQTLLVTLTGGIISTLVICTFYFWLPINKGQFEQLTTDIILLSCLVTPATMLARLLIALTRGVGRISSAAKIYIVQNAVLFVLLFIFLVYFRADIKTAVLLTALSPLVPVAISIWVLRDYATLRRSEFNGELFKKGLSFGSQISLSTIARLLNYRLDQMILAFMVPIEQVGFYLVAVGFAERLRLLPNSIASAFLPRLANELDRRQAEVPRVFRYTVIISVASMLLIAVIGIPVIPLIFGTKYAGSVVSFLWLLPGVAALGGNAILASDLAAREKPKYSVWNGYTTLTLNIILNLMLIPRLGIAGAAIASSISYIFAGLLWLIFFKRESHTPLKSLLPGAKDIVYLYKNLFTILKTVKKPNNE